MLVKQQMLVSAAVWRMRVKNEEKVWHSNAEWSGSSGVRGGGGSVTFITALCPFVDSITALHLHREGQGDREARQGAESGLLGIIVVSLTSPGPLLCFPSVGRSAMCLTPVRRVCSSTRS